MKVAILGVGTVGSSVINLLQKNKDTIFARAGVEIVPVVGVVKNKNKPRVCNIEITDNIQSVINRDDIDVFVELMGGIDFPFKTISQILKKKKPVVTANKALLAYHRYELEKLARQSYFCYEASVCGGIPIIKTLRDGLSANEFVKIIGILNGTSNFILTNMMKDGLKFNEALRQAQNLGYAEADPKFDIGGIDAAHKLLILSSLAYGINCTPEDILVEGIENITTEDIYFAKEFDYCIKLLAISKNNENNIELRVHPTMIDKNSILAKVDGVMNGVGVFADAVRQSMYYGPGAGGEATASSVISDLIEIARGNKSPTLGYKFTNNKKQLLHKEDIKTKYYLRLKVKDEVGVLAKTTNLMEQNNISIESFLQKPNFTNEDKITLFFTTHTSLEKDVINFIKEIKRHKISNKPFMIRIEN